MSRCPGCGSKNFACGSFMDGDQLVRSVACANIAVRQSPREEEIVDESWRESLGEGDEDVDLDEEDSW